MTELFKKISDNHYKTMRDQSEVRVGCNMRFYQISSKTHEIKTFYFIGALAKDLVPISTNDDNIS